ncbi:MAG TPA: universal stress protein [Pirellulaceae bacterium]|nr:universal stress protein [Pirellulaceae bacterium]
MKANKILVPTDFSEGSEMALDWATVLARDTGATLLLLHVEAIPLTTGGGEFMYLDTRPPTAELAERLERVAPKDPGVPVVRRLLTGDPASAILRTAEEEDVELIVMGTHGRRGITRLLMGSVAEEVVRKAPCPVLTVKQPARVAAHAAT